MQVTISGYPGSGKSTVAKRLAKKLNYRFYSVGGIRRKIAQKRNLTILEFNKLKEDTDTEVDNYQKELGKKKKNIIVEGRLAFHFLPKSKKIFFDVDLNIGAERIFKDQRPSEKKYNTKEETLKAIKERIRHDKKRYKQIYNLDAFDKSNFDYVIDTTNLTIDEVEKKALDFIKS